MKAIKIALASVVFFISTFAAVLAQQPAPNQAAIQQANTDLDSLARELAKLVAEPGFRGFLRSEIAKSKNREQILELDRFLERAGKQKSAPKELGKYRDKAKGIDNRIKKSNLNAFEGLDLYIPVDAHRRQWKGGKDFLVAFSPLDNETNIKQIVAYQVWDGKRVFLDPNNAPDTVVLVLAPEEHYIHTEPKPAEPSPPPEGLGFPVKFTSPPGQVYKNEQGDVKEEIGKYPGNSRLYAYYTMFKTDKEPWYKGSPEIEVYLILECGGGLKYKRLDATGADKTYTRHYTAKYGYLSFDDTCSDVGITAIWERDGGSWIRGDCYTFPSGRRHCYNVRSGDDFITGHAQYHTDKDSGRFYRSALPYSSVSGYPRMGANGDIDLYKLH